MKFVDLSVVINEETPVYPGDPKTKIEPAAILEKDGYEDSCLSTGTHAGTHVDAPRHMVAGGKGLDEITVDRFVGNGVLINVNKKFDLSQIRSVDIPKDSIVLFSTSMSALYNKDGYYDSYPAMTNEIARYLVSKEVKMVGVDMCSVDYEPFSAHKILLGSEVLIIENLTNLEKLAGVKFRVYALPMKLEVDGAPARVIAEII